MRRTIELITGKTAFPLFFIFTTLILLSIISIKFFSLAYYDETLYLAHIQLVMQGKLPYHDFFEWVPPIWLYLYAGVFSIFGENTTVARIFSTILGLGSIALVLRLAWKHSGKWAALIALAIITFVYPLATELTRFYYTASAFLFVIVAISIEDAFPRNKFTSIIVEILFTVATGTVQAFGLLILIYPIYLWFICKEKKTALLAFGAGLFTGGLIAAPFLLTDYQATFWAMFSYSKEVIPLRWDFTWKTHLAYIIKSFLEFPLIWFPIIFLSVKEIRQCLFDQRFQIRFDKIRPVIFSLLWMAFFGIAFAVFLFNPTTFMQQHVYYLPIGCILVADFLTKWIRSLKINQQIAVSLSLIICLVGTLLFSRLNFINSIVYVLNTPREENLEKVILITKYLMKDNPEAKIFTFVPYFGLEAGSKIFPGTEYGISSFTLNWSEEKATRYHFFTGSQTMDWIETSQPDLIVMVDKTRQTMSCCGPKNGVEFLKQLESIIPKYYSLVDSFIVNDYWGEVRFFKRKVQSGTN